MFPTSKKFKYFLKQVIFIETLSRNIHIEFKVKISFCKKHFAYKFLSSLEFLREKIIYTDEHSS